MIRLICWLTLGVVLALGLSYFHGVIEPDKTDIALKQFQDDSGVVKEMRTQNMIYNHLNQVIFLSWGFLGLILFFKEILMYSRKVLTVSSALLLLCMTGCYRPYEPVVFESVNTSETAFLLPLSGDLAKQEAFTSEKYLQENMIAAKEVQIPHRWVQLGYETWGPNGKWMPSARLVKVDRAPETREWTADPNSGTSNKNEAIWVMTSDSVAFSTGWTCTARIETSTDAVKFLFNYPTGSLDKVMDTEVRSKIQAVFGLLVTDRPMDELRMKSTPLFKQVESEVKEFFQVRGITITNLGITGGYVYQDHKIQETLNKVFQAQQDQLTAQAERNAQEERNKTVKLAAEGLAEASKAKAAGEAEAVKSKAQGEADAIRLVADAKSYEMKQAQENLDLYMGLKRMDLDKQKLEKWDGQFPYYFMGGSGSSPDMLLQLPAPPAQAPPRK